MKCRILFLSVLAAASVAAADSPIAAPAERPSAFATDVLVSNGEGFFAVWHDRFTDTSGAIFDGNGEPVADFPVVATYKEDYNPASVWNGSEYLTLVDARGLGLFAVGVNPAGEVRGLSIPMQGPLHGTPALAWNGSHYAYAVHRDGALTLYLLDASLQIDKTFPLADTRDFDVRITTDGSRFLVVWHQRTANESEIYMQLFDEDGGRITPRVRIGRRTTDYVESFGINPAVAWNGTGYLVVWPDDEGLRSLLVSRDGVIGIPATIIATTGAASPSLGWDGYAHLLTWNEPDSDRGGAIRPAAAFVTATGDFIERVPIDVATHHGSTAAIASNGDAFFLIWSGERVVIRSTGTRGVERHADWTVATYQPQRTVSLAAADSSLLAAWHEGTKVYAGRLSHDQEPLDGSGIVLAEDIRGIGRRPVITKSGDTWLVSWFTLDSVMAARITEHGELIDEEPLVLTTGGGRNVVAAAGDDSFLVFASRDVPATMTETRQSISGWRVPLRGPVVAITEDEMFPAEYQQWVHGLVRHEDGFTLIWSQQTSPCQGRYCSPVEGEVRSTRLNQAGEPIRTWTLATNIVPVAVLATRNGEIRILYSDGGYAILPVAGNGEPLAPPPVGVVNDGVGNEGARGSMIETPGGYLAAEGRYALWFDRDGVQISPPISLNAPLHPERWIEDVASDDSRIWIVYGTAWRIRPKAHDQTIPRAYIQELRRRARAVRK